LKRLQRTAVWLVCVGLILAPTQLGTVLGQSLNEAPASLKLLRSDQQAIVIELSTPFYALQAAKIGSTGVQRITVPGLIQSEQSGMPELPTIGKLLAVPAGVQVSLNFLTDQSQLLSGRYVLPIAPEPARLNEELQPGTFQEPTPATQASPELRAQGYLPTAPAWIAEEVWLRDQRMVRIVFSPFQYDLSTGQLLWHRLLQVELVFSGQENLDDRVTYRDPIFEPVYRQSVFNYDSASSWRSKAPSRLAPETNARATATATRYRIVVDHPGMYRLTYNDLQAAGLPVDQVDPRNLQLTNQGRDVAILVNGEQDGELNPGDEVLFYGEDFRGDVMASVYASEDDTWLSYNGWQAQLTPEYFERYTADNVYWLWVQDTPGLRMPAPISGTPNGSGIVPQVFTDTVRAEQSHRYWSFHFTNQDPWIWDDVPVTSVATRTYTTTLMGVAPGNFSAKLQGEILSNRSSLTGSPDHHTWFTLNGSTQKFSEALWDGPIRQPFSAQLPQSLLIAGTNQLHMTAKLTENMISDRITFDWFSIEYARLFQAVGDQLTFEFDEAGQVWEYHITNFTVPDLQVFDITNPLAPIRIENLERNIYYSLYLPLVTQNSDSSFSIQTLAPNPQDRNSAIELVFQASHPGRTRYLALASPALQTPKTISAYTPPDLYASDNGADYLIIAPAEFVSTSQTLADYRAAQGLRTLVVDIQDVYNLFSHGIVHPLAIKSFLSYANQFWSQPAPAFAVLVGDGHWNFKGYSGQTESGSYAYINSPISMPPYMAWVDPWQGEVDSSNLLATIAGGDILPDLSIARLPVNTLSQLQAAIDKIIAYESSPGAAWQQRLMFAADNPDYAGDFNSLSEYVIGQSTPPDYAIDRIYLDTFPANSGAQAAYAITTTLNLTGTLFMNYIGHASISRWAAEGMLVTTGDPALTNSPLYNHIVTLDNASRLPVMVSMDCLDGYWNYAVDQWTALAEEMVRAPDKGAVAAYSPTGLGVASGHDILNRGFYAAIFEGSVQELGPAAIASKAELFAYGHYDDLIDTFTVFGDPALRFLTTVSPAHAAQTAAWNTDVIYNLQVTNTDVYTGTPAADTFTLSAQGNIWQVNLSQNNLTLLPGETANIQVTVKLPAPSPAYTTDYVEINIASSRLNAVIASATLVTTGSASP
jgi:hypothetical protein